MPERPAAVVIDICCTLYSYRIRICVDALTRIAFRRWSICVHMELTSTEDFAPRVCTTPRASGAHPLFGYAVLYCSVLFSKAKLCVCRAVSVPLLQSRARAAPRRLVQSF